jgi:drug/metabolite transporter (DMT)-like permease
MERWPVQHTAIVVTIALSVVAVAGDYALKHASLTRQGSPYLTLPFFLGMAAHGSAVFGWVWVMQHLKLAYVGVFYSLPIIVLLAVIGHLWFGESLRPAEILGVFLALVSLILLARLA